MAIGKLNKQFRAGERLSTGKLNAITAKVDELVEETNKYDGVAEALEALSPDQSGALALAKRVVDVERDAARRDSYYPSMGVSSADCIAPRGNAVAQTIGSGVSAKDATKKIAKLKGKTMKWQQMVQNITDSYVHSGVNWVYSVDGYVTATGTSTAVSFSYESLTVNLYSNHKYLFNNIGQQINNCIPQAFTTNGNRTLSTLGFAPVDGVYYIRMRASSGITFNGERFKLILIDLTACGLDYCNTADDVAKVFGFATWDAFAASPNFASLMEYTEQPRLINTNAVGIRTTDGYGDEHYTDIDVKRVVDSECNLLFPEGLQGVGEVFDEFTPTKATARLKKARLADFSWTYYNGRFFAQIADAKRVTTYPYGENTHAVCSLYPIDSSATSTQNDKTIRVNQGNDTSGYMYIRDTDYSDVPSFVAHLGDAELVYELAEPIEIDLAHPLNLTYPVSKGGVEEAVYEGEAGLPIEADVIEGGSVVDAIEQTPISQQAWAILMADKLGIAADKVGVVDLGSLTWRYANESSDLKPRFYANVETPAYGDQKVHNVVAVGYTTDSWNNVCKKTGSVADKGISVSTAGGSAVFICDSAYTSAAAFNTAMQGVFLYYEKA